MTMAPSSDTGEAPHSSQEKEDKKRKPEETETCVNQPRKKKEKTEVVAQSKRSIDDSKLQEKLRKAQEKAEKEHEKVRRAEDKAKKEQERLKKAREKAERDEAKEEEKILKAMEKEAKDAEKETKRLKAQTEKEEREKKAKEKDAKEAEREMKKKKAQDALKKQASLMGKFLAKAVSPVKSNGEDGDNRQGGDGEVGGLQHLEEGIQAIVVKMDTELADCGEATPSQLLEGYKVGWKRLSTSLRHKKPARWGIRRFKKVEVIKELRLQRPLLEQLQAPPPTSAKGSVCSADGDDDFDLEIIDMSGVRRGESRTDRRPKRRRLLQHDHARPPYYGDYGNEPPSSNTVTGRRPFGKDSEMDYNIDSGDEWEDEDPDADVLSDLDQDGAGSDNGEQEEEDGFIVDDGYLSADEGHHEAGSSDDETPAAAPEPGSSSIPPQGTDSTGISKEVQRAWHKVSRCIQKALLSGKPLIISSLSVADKTAKAPENNGGGQGFSAPVTFMTADPELLKAFAIEVLSEVVIDVPQAQAAEEDGGNVREETERRRVVPRAAKAFPEECLPKLASVLMQTQQNKKKYLEVLQELFPTHSKISLENGMRRVADYIGNSWQVKPEVIERFGLSSSSHTPSEVPPRPSLMPLVHTSPSITKFMLQTPDIKSEGPPPRSSVTSKDSTFQNGEMPQHCREEEKEEAHETREERNDCLTNIVGPPPCVHPVY